jgi:membrane protein DedA with SNARE-associated domain
VRTEEQLSYLRIALYAIGGIFIVGVPLLMMAWTDGFAWEPAQSEYEQMIMGIYITLGVFLILAARDPLANRSLIWFTVWSSIAHGSIMLVQAIVDDAERMNLLGDVPALFLVAAVLGLLMPRGQEAAHAQVPAART